MLPSGWIVPENRALALRPTIIGLPLGFAAVLIMAVLFIGPLFNLYGAALWLLAFGWGLGKLVTFYDPFAWELLAMSLKIPRVLRP